MEDQPQQTGESSMWHEFQYFCSQGYGVVYANPRGSGGYGKIFNLRTIKIGEHIPAEDVLAAASDAAKESWVDTSKQVLTGGSYAGYLTAWIVGHDHRFKAAFAQRGVYDLTTFMGEGNAWRLVPNYFGGYPWEEKIKPILERESPYTYR
jgi:dipeptidyl aminopeptidase/acylaminoacyl peptidase